MTATAVSSTTGVTATPDYVTAQVMGVLLAVRATAADGSAYDQDAKLSDAGFTSMEMVNVMLAIEGAFDLTIPQNEITPGNFASATAIAALVRKLKD